MCSIIYKTFYKDRPAIALECPQLTALFLPEDGAKLASLKAADGAELLEQAKGERYMRLGMKSEYVDCECSAFDDMFPTIDPCVINGYSYPDHGEVCRRPHSCTVSEDSVSFKCNLESVNAVFAKTAYIEDSTLCARYTVKNRNSFTLPYIWAGHMMFAGACSAYVTDCFAQNAEKTVMFGNAPMHEKIHILDRFNENGESYKYYYNEPASPLSCGITYPAAKKEVSVSFDTDTVKYLGIWMNNGGFKQMYNIALEPCTAPFDSPVNSAVAGKDSFIPADGTIEFTLRIKISQK